jgi:hypothetical protein
MGLPRVEIGHSRAREEWACLAARETAHRMRRAARGVLDVARMTEVAFQNFENLLDF